MVRRHWRLQHGGLSYAEHPKGSRSVVCRLLGLYRKEAGLGVTIPLCLRMVECDTSDASERYCIALACGGDFNSLS